MAYFANKTQGPYDGSGTVRQQNFTGSAPRTPQPTPGAKLNGTPRARRRGARKRKRY